MFTLGINTAFAMNRYPEPEEWTRIVSDLGLKYAQLTASMVNPSLPENIIKRRVAEINEASASRGISIPSVFTDAYTQLNHLSHPDKEIRHYWLRWFIKLIDISTELGADSIGSHIGIVSMKDARDAERRKHIFDDTIRAWTELSDYAKSAGLKYLTWEPMSVAREHGETLLEARRIHDELNKNSAVPIKMNLDIDHGLKTSGNPDDINPIAWIKEFGSESSVLHIKQTYGAKGGPFPFLPEYNKEGIIKPAEIINALEKSGCSDCLLALEINAPGREPGESNLIDWLKQSVDYWRPHVKE